MTKKVLFNNSLDAKPVQNVTDSYEQKLSSEQAFYNDCADVHQLPDIFHYWSNKYLRPKHSPFGITDPEHFFYLYCKRQCESYPDKRIDIVSVGAGNCDMESRLATHLLAEGQSNFYIECLDINERMLARGSEHAAASGVADYFDFQKGDFNRWAPTKTYDVVIANQALHHVLDLEHLFSTIRGHLKRKGVFLVSDMIGRNGHVRWPEAMAALSPFWAELPEAYRYNQLLRRYEGSYLDHDCSSDGFEGIRAQDILPLLVKEFHFELFIPFANIIMAFIDRTFGHNFDASAQWDREFIDRVHARDEQGILSGELTPTQMMAVMRNQPTETQLVDPRLTPEFCIRHP